MQQLGFSWWVAQLSLSPLHSTHTHISESDKIYLVTNYCFIRESVRVNGNKNARERSGMTAVAILCYSLLLLRVALAFYKFPD